MIVIVLHDRDRCRDRACVVVLCLRRHGSFRVLSLTRSTGPRLWYAVRRDSNRPFARCIELVSWLRADSSSCGGRAVRAARALRSLESPGSTFARFDGSRHHMLGFEPPKAQDSPRPRHLQDNIMWISCGFALDSSWGSPTRRAARYPLLRAAAGGRLATRFVERFTTRFTMITTTGRRVPTMTRPRQPARLRGPAPTVAEARP